MCQIPFDYICLLLQYAIPFILQPFQISSEFEKNVFQDVVLRLKGLCLFFFVYHVGGCAQLFTFHAFEKVGFGNFRTFPFQFRLFFFSRAKKPTSFDFDGSKSSWSPMTKVMLGSNA